MLPLTGVRVVELGHIVAGPSAGLILAELGADVIKIELPKLGDMSRRMPGASTSSFYLYNRNKRSLAVDLKAPAGAKVLQRLVGRAEIVVDNFAPGVLERLELSYEHFVGDNPGLIWLSIKGFLPGPYEHRPSLDELAQMMGGLAYMTGPPGQPLRAGASVIDIGAATYGVIGVLAALLERQRNGKGQKIVSGLFETTVFWVGQWIARAAASGDPSVPMPEVGQSRRMGWGVYHLFTTSDDEQVFIGVTSDGQWRRFCQEFELADLLADERLATNAQRVHERGWLLPRLRQEATKYSGDDLQAKLERSGVPYAPVRRPDQLAEDPHLKATGQLMEVPLAEGKLAKLPKLPFRSTEYDFELRRPAPKLGEHSREVLEEMGCSPEEIRQLIAEGAVAD